VTAIAKKVGTEDFTCQAFVDGAELMRELSDSLQ
jgi:hypothetical protein